MATTPEMAFEVETTGPCRRKVSVTIPAELVTDEFNKTYQNLIKTVPIQGFRPGKAPRGLIEKRFGPQVALEVKQTLLDSAYEKALKAKELSPIDSPEVDNVEALNVEPKAPLAFSFTLTVKPEFELPDLKGLEVKVPSAEPSDEELEAAMKHMRRAKATLRPVEGGRIEGGDVVTLDVRGTHEGEELFAKDDLVYEVGTKFFGGMISEDLDAALEGKGAGDAFEATSYAPPHEPNHPLAGIAAAIAGTVVGIKRPDLPAVDEELAKSLDFESLDELKETILKDVTARKERERDKLIENLALAQLIEKAEFELPAELIAKEVDELATRAAYALQQDGKSEEEIAGRIAEIKAARREETENELRRFFVLDKIVEVERVLVTESEVRNAVSMIAAYNQLSPEEMYANLRDSGRLGTLRNQLRETKAREKLRKKVVVSDA